jgi:hypothetical protein
LIFPGEEEEINIRTNGTHSHTYSHCRRGEHIRVGIRWRRTTALLGKKEKRESRETDKQAKIMSVKQVPSIHASHYAASLCLSHELESGVVLLSIIIGISLRDQQEENLLFLVQQQEIERILFVLSSALLSTSCSSNDRRSSGDSS